MALSSTTRKWLRYALDDLKVARTLKTLESSHWRACTYHAQQAVEKVTKAYLIHHQVRVPKIHDIAKLAELVAQIDPNLAKEISTSKRLTKYAIEYRYPSAAKNPVTRKKATSAAELAERVYELVAANLQNR